MRRLLFKNVHLKAFFQRFILKVVRGYILHLVFELQIGENLLDILHAENTHFDGVVSRTKKAHTAWILYFNWLMFYAKNEAADIFFVMKPKTGRISLFHAAI